MECESKAGAAAKTLRDPARRRAPDHPLLLPRNRGPADRPEGDAHGLAHGEPAHGEPHGHGNSRDLQSDPNHDRHRYRDSNLDADVLADFDNHTDPDPRVHSHTKFDRHGIADRDSLAHIHGYGNGNCHAHAHPLSHFHSDRNADAALTLSLVILTPSSSF